MFSHLELVVLSFSVLQILYYLSLLITTRTTSTETRVDRKGFRMLLSKMEGEGLLVQASVSTTPPGDPMQENLVNIPVITRVGVKLDCPEVRKAKLNKNTIRRNRIVHHTAFM